MANCHYVTDLANLKGASFACLNVCSVLKKIDKIRSLLARSDLDVLGINESWLHSNIDSNELDIDGYTAHRFDRDLGSGKRMGGGLLVYTKNKYVFKSLENWNLCNPDAELMWVKLELKLSKPTYICISYRPPSGNRKLP